MGRVPLPGRRPCRGGLSQGWLRLLGPALTFGLTSPDLDSSRGHEGFLDTANWGRRPNVDLGTLGCKCQKLTLASAGRGIDYPLGVSIWGLLEPQTQLDLGAPAGMFRALSLTSSPCGLPSHVGCLLWWPRWLPAAPGRWQREHLFLVGQQTSQSILTDVVLVTCPSLNQSLRLGRDCADEPDLGHVTPEPGLRGGGDHVQQKRETPSHLDPWGPPPP